MVALRVDTRDTMQTTMARFTSDAITSDIQEDSITTSTTFVKDVTSVKKSFVLAFKPSNFKKSYDKSIPDLKVGG